MDLKLFREVVFFVLMFFSLFSFGQKECKAYDEYSVSKKPQESTIFSIGPGAIVNEYSNSLYTTKNFTKLVSIERTIRKNNSFWESMYNYPEFGLGFQIQTLGNNDVNGVETSLIPFTKLHLFSKKKMEITAQFGLGLSYVTRKYNAITNPLNVAIGSNLNAHFQTKIWSSFKLKEKKYLLLGLSFDHLSNANFSEPNLGINSLSFLLAYQINQYVWKDLEHTVGKVYTPKERFQLLGNIGGKHARALSSTFYFISSFTTDWFFYVNPRFAISTGFDLFYDTSIPTELKTTNQVFKPQNYFQSGVHINPVLRYKNLNFGLSIGVYLGLPELVGNKILYSRVFAEYHFKKHVFLRMAMKSHLHILEYPEIGVGFKFLKR